MIWRSGEAVAACELAYQSLSESDLPASSWLTSEETRKAIAIYNTALAMFVFEYSKKLAGGRATLSVQTPLGPRIVAARYASDSRYTAGYFEELIPSDYVWLAGFRRRTRVDGLGVPLVGVRKRTEARKAELRFQPPNHDVFVALGCFAEFEPRRDGSRMDITFLDLDRTATVQIGGEFIPLAADFTAPLALASGGMNDLMLGIRAILNAGASADVKGIYSSSPSTRIAFRFYFWTGLCLHRLSGATQRPLQLRIRSSEETTSFGTLSIRRGARHAVRRTDSR